MSRLLNVGALVAIFAVTLAVAVVAGAYGAEGSNGFDPRQHFDWLVAEGFFVPVGDGRYELTDKGQAAADLGFYEV